MPRRKRIDPPSAEQRMAALRSRARESAMVDLGIISSGGDPDADHSDYPYYRVAGTGARDLPSFTHDRQIQMAHAAYLVNPLARRIIELTKDYIVADGFHYDAEPSEAEREAERKTQTAKAAAGAASLDGQPMPFGGKPFNPAKRPAPGIPAPDTLPATSKEAEAPPAPDTPDSEPDTAAEPSSADVREVLDEHWTDPDNSWEIKQHARVVALSLWGEQLYPAFVTPDTGHVKIGSIDPYRIRSVDIDPDNAERVISVTLKDVNGEPGKVYKIIQISEDPEDKGFLVGARDGEVAYNGRRYDGSAFYFAVNRVMGARRGHSDLMHLLDWLDAYDTLLFDSVDAAKMQRAFVWDVTLEDADEKTCQDRARTSRLPRPGGVLYHNQKEKWVALAPNLEAVQHEVFARMIRTHILGGAGLPMHWFGEGDSATRATAKEMSPPVVRRLKARQQFIIYMIALILRFQIDQAILAGRLVGDESTKDRLRIDAPEFESTDVALGAAALAQGTSALQLAEQAKWVTLDTARRGFASLAEHSGIKIQPDDEAEVLDAMTEAQTKSRIDALDTENKALRSFIGDQAKQQTERNQETSSEITRLAASAVEDARRAAREEMLPVGASVEVGS